MNASCQCGALTATVSGEGARVVCHCRACQRRSGSPFGYIAYYSAGNVDVAGEWREFARPTDSGGNFANRFCPTCGSSVIVVSSKHPDKLGIPVGAFADAGFPAPQRTVYNDFRHEWVVMPGGLETHARGRS